MVKARFMVKKLQNQRGETLVETLVSIVIATLSIAMVASASVVASQIIQTGRAEQNDFSAAVQAAETKNAAVAQAVVTASEVSVGADGAVVAVPSATSGTVAVQVYGAEDIYSYAEAPAVASQEQAN